MTGTITVRRMALGVLLVGFEGTNATGVPYWLLDMLGNGVAGVTIFGRNITAEDPVGNLAALARGLRHGRPELLVSIDEEGGDVTRLDTRTGSMFLGQGSLGAVDDEAETRRSSALLGARLASAGVNLNFAPVADVASNANSPIVGSRSFSADPQCVARHVAASIAGYLDSGVAPTAKHFPGHGSTAEDSHFVVPVVEADLDTLWERELPPFQSAIAAGVPVIMTGHLMVPALDAESLATMSPRIITGLLRRELGFSGVVVTDGLDMHAISRTVGRPEAVVRALLAGVDLMCIGGDSVSPEVVEDIVSAIEEAVQSGRLELARLAEANERVATLASRWAHNGALGGRTQGPPMLDVARSSLRVVGDPSMAETATVVELRNEPSMVAGEVAFGMGRPLLDRSSNTRVVHLERGMPVPELGTGGLVVSVRDCHLIRGRRRRSQHFVEPIPHLSWWTMEALLRPRSWGLAPSSPRMPPPSRLPLRPTFCRETQVRMWRWGRGNKSERRGGGTPLRRSTSRLGAPPHRRKASSMLAISRFQDVWPGFAAEAEGVAEFWRSRPGCLGVDVVRNLDDQDLWAIVSRWENVGAYRRSFNGFDAKMILTPVLGRAIDEPSAYLPPEDLGDNIPRRG